MADAAAQGPQSTEALLDAAVENAENLHVCRRCGRRKRAADGTEICSIDGDAITNHAFSGKCPFPQINKFDYFRARDAGKATDAGVVDEEWATAGPKMWEELHRRALAWDGKAPELERAWSDKFAARIPCGKCKQHWNALRSQYTVDLSSPDAYFTWTVSMHDLVNVNLGRATFGLTQARAKWTTSPA